MVFERNGWLFGSETVTCTVHNDKVHVENSGNFISKELPYDYTVSTKEFLSGLRKLHIGNWKKEYLEDGDYVTCDGIDWKLKIVYSDGRPAFESQGSNAYPDNYADFESFLGIKNYDEENDDDPDNIDKD